MEINRDNNKPLSIFAIVMINVIAVDSLRSLPFSAEFGFSLVFYYVVFAFLFFIPTALIAAELATGWPKTGGLYIWVSEAFNYRTGFLAIWLQWVYNIVWYPTILSFVATTLAYLIDPALAKNKYYLLPTVLGIFYLATIANLFGMRFSSKVSIFGAIIGTLLPMLAIITLGVMWVMQGHPSQINFTWQDLWPDISSLNRLVFVSALIFSLMGIEMSAVHAGDVENPQRDYPKALFYSTCIILFTLILSSLAIAVVVPQQQLSLVSGVLDAFIIFFNAYHMPWASSLFAVLIVIGATCSVAAWIIGPTRGLLVATRDSHTVAFLQKINKYGAPQNILLLQSIIFTVICSAFLLMPSINSAFVVLSALTEKLALMVYLFIFISAIVLRYRKPNVPRAYRVPGGNVGMWIVASAASLTCILVIALGFIPPAQVYVGSIMQYELILVFGVIACCLPPLWLTRHHQGS